MFYQNKEIELEIDFGILHRSQSGFSNYHHDIKYQDIFDNFEEIEIEKYFNQPKIDKAEVDRLCKEVIKKNLDDLNYSVIYDTDISRFLISW